MIKATGKASVEGKVFLLLSAAFLFIAFYLLPVRHGAFLRWMEEFSFFDSSPSAVESMLCYPGGVLQYAGSFLTQFMYHPWTGSAILISLWALTVVLALKAFRPGRSTAIIALCLPAALLASVLQADSIWLTFSVGTFHRLDRHANSPDNHLCITEDTRSTLQTLAFHFNRHFYHCRHWCCRWSDPPSLFCSHPLSGCRYWPDARETVSCHRYTDCGARGS